MPISSGPAHGGAGGLQVWRNEYHSISPGWSKWWASAGQDDSYVNDYDDDDGDGDDDDGVNDDNDDAGCGDGVDPGGDLAQADQPLQWEKHSGETSFPLDHDHDDYE